MASAVDMRGEAQRAAVVARLKEQIQKVQAAPRQYLFTLATGVAAVDALGLFRLGGAVELSGEESSGRTSLALSLVAAAGREQRLSAWVDGPSELYPPAAVPLGVALERLLIVRPKAPRQLVWTAVQLLRSGAFTCVVLDVTHTGVQLSLTDGKKLQDAARSGGALLVVLTSQAVQGQGFVRLELKTQLPLPAQRGEGGVRGDDGVRENPIPLRVVPPPAEAQPEPSTSDVFLVSVARSSHGGYGRQLSVARSSLEQRTGVAPRRARRPGDAALPGLQVPTVAPALSHHRVKSRDAREGYGPGLYGLPVSLPLPAERGEGRGEGRLRHRSRRRRPPHGAPATEVLH